MHCCELCYSIPALMFGLNIYLHFDLKVLFIALFGNRQYDAFILMRHYLQVKKMHCKFAVKQVLQSEQGNGTSRPF